MRDLDRDASAVAGLRVAAAGASMGEIDQDLKALVDNGVAFFSAQAGDEAHAASIVLVAGIVETLRGRQAGEVLFLGIQVHALLRLQDKTRLVLGGFENLGLLGFYPPHLAFVRIAGLAVRFVMATVLGFSFITRGIQNEASRANSAHQKIDVTHS